MICTALAKFTRVPVDGITHPNVNGVYKVAKKYGIDFKRVFVTPTGVRTGSNAWSPIGGDVNRLLRGRWYQSNTLGSNWDNLFRVATKNSPF